MDKLRAYIWTHASLGSVDRAVQTAHTVGELSRNLTGTEFFNQWASKDKTLILLNPGRSKGVRDGCQTIMSAFGGTKCSTGVMVEDQNTMEGMTTSFGVIIPERYIDSVKELRLYEGSARYKKAERLADDLASELRAMCRPSEILCAINYIIDSSKAI